MCTAIVLCMTIFLLNPYRSKNNIIYCKSMSFILFQYITWYLVYTILDGWDGCDDHVIKEVYMTDKSAEQEEPIHATMWISRLCKIMIPNIGLKDISNPALRHSFLTLSLPTCSLLSTFKMSPNSTYWQCNKSKPLGPPMSQCSR